MQGERVTKEHILKSGYKEYPPSRLDHPGVVAKYQKRFDDDKGKKYFIDIKEWEPCRHPYTGETFPESFEFEAQMYSKGNHNAVDLEFHVGWTIEEVEKYVEALFQTGMFDYYEEYTD